MTSVCWSQGRVFGCAGEQQWAARDAELSIDGAQMVLDGTRADEELVGDVAVGPAGDCESGDLQFH